MTQRQRLRRELSRTAWQRAEELALWVYAKEFQKREQSEFPILEKSDV